MMHVCQHERFSVNYACVCCSSDEGKVARNRGMARQGNTITKDAHFPFAAWAKCHVYESKRYCQDIQKSGMQWPG